MLPRSRGQRLYTPPRGYYDLPFTWAYEASALTVGQNYPNQYVYLLGGYGDFILRRIVGLSKLLDTTAGQFQIRDGIGNYLNSDKEYSKNVTDQLLGKETRYPELGAIRFDLYNFNPSWTNSPQAAQLAFQGVRRMKGTATRPTYKYKEKSFVYIVSGVLTTAYPAPAVSVSQVINDYDFDLYEVIVLQGGYASLLVLETSSPDPGMLFTAVLPGSSGDAVTITISGTGAVSQALSVTVVGSAITINLGTNSLGQVTSTGAQVLAAYNAVPAAVALASLTFQGSLSNIAAFSSSGPTHLAGGAIAAITDPICQVWLYDQNRVQISNVPINDVFLNGGPGSFYNNGAIVPPLYYRQQSRIQIDLYSLLGSKNVPQVVTMYLVGKQLYPC